MKFFAFFLFLAPLALRAEPVLPSALVLTQVAYLNLGDATGSFFHSRIRVTFRETLFLPQEVSTSTRSSTDDLGNVDTSTTISLDGSPLGKSELNVDEVDANGLVLRSLAQHTQVVSHLDVFPATKNDFYPHPLSRVSVPVAGGRFTIVDSSGKRVLFTIDSHLQPTVFFDPAEMEYLQSSDAAVEFSASFAYLPGEKSYSPNGPVFSLRDQAIPENLAKTGECSTAGENVEVSPIIVGSHLLARRVQICHNSGTGHVLRSVLIEQNPPHEPADAKNRVYAAALQYGGQIATAPLFVLPPEKISYANCHGYALLATLGSSALPENAYWLQAEIPARYSLGTNALEPFLARSFAEVLSFPSSYYDKKAEINLANEKRLREGDFITFEGGGGFAHSGIIRKNLRDGSWWIESKYEEGPVIDTPIANVHDVIRNLYTKIRIFRKK